MSKTVLMPASASPLKFLVQTAKHQAVVGMAAGVVIGVVHGVAAVRRNRLRDRYDVITEGITQVGNGVIIGLCGGVAASVAGVSAAAIIGRGIWVTAAPLVASALVTNSVQGPVDRLVRPWSEGFIKPFRPVRESDGPDEQGMVSMR